MSSLFPLATTIELAQITCGLCGGTYAIAERFRQECENQARWWHCPYCDKTWGYSGKTAEQKEHERHMQTLARLNQANVEREDLKRKLRRVQRGVCPHCNRSFQNLARHMACKHRDKP